MNFNETKLLLKLREKKKMIMIAFGISIIEINASHQSDF